MEAVEDLAVVVSAYAQRRKLAEECFERKIQRMEQAREDEATILRSEIAARDRAIKRLTQAAKLTQSDLDLINDLTDLPAEQVADKFEIGVPVVLAIWNGQI